MEEQKFRKLNVWNKSMDLIEQIYRTTQKFPGQEVYGLTSQLRRASTSIALNIAEGSGSGSDGEFKRFLNIALRSAYEAICAIEIAKRLGFCSMHEANTLKSGCDEISAMLTGLKKHLVGIRAAGHKTSDD